MNFFSSFLKAACTFASRAALRLSSLAAFYSAIWILALW